MHAAYYVVMAYVIGAALLGWLYFRSYRITRPPIGVINLKDVAFMLGAIVLIPFLYLTLPPWVAGGLLAVGVLTILYITWEPVLGARWAVWLASFTLLGTDVGVLLLFGATSTAFFVVNNTVLIVGVVGATNLWAQSGMKARDLAVLASGLAVYDFVATSQLPLMDDLIGRLAAMPLAPQVAWRIGDGFWLGVGLGDLLLATVFSLVMRKAYGRSAGLVALVLALGAIGVMLALLDLEILRVTLPAMVVLGPIMVLQYAFYHRRRGRERTTWQYLEAEPMRSRVAILTSARAAAEHASHVPEPGSMRIPRS